MVFCYNEVAQGITFFLHLRYGISDAFYTCRRPLSLACERHRYPECKGRKPTWIYNRQKSRFLGDRSDPVLFFTHFFLLTRFRSLASQNWRSASSQIVSHFLIELHKKSRSVFATALLCLRFLKVFLRRLT